VRTERNRFHGNLDPCAGYSGRTSSFSLIGFIKKCWLHLLSIIEEFTLSLAITLPMSQQRGCFANASKSKFQLISMIVEIGSLG
jgi:hypothetical protein